MISDGCVRMHIHERSLVCTHSGAKLEQGVRIEEPDYWPYSGVSGVLPRAGAEGFRYPVVIALVGGSSHFWRSLFPKKYAAPGGENGGLQAGAEGCGVT